MFTYVYVCLCMHGIVVGRQMKALEEVLSVDIPDVMRRFDNPF